jgi:glycosyltransferase involved in cell wall biosynthesis
MSLTVMQVLHQGGGAGSVISTLHLSLKLAQAGLRIRFVCPPNSEVEGLARAGGLEVHPLGLPAGRTWHNADALHSLLVRHPVDLVNSQSARDRNALACLALTRRLQPPLVVTRRQMPQTLSIENWVVSRLATRVVAVSPAVAAALVRRGTPRAKLAIIPNGLVSERVDLPVTPAALANWRERIGWEPSRRVVGIVARLKDQSVVLRALDQVATPVRLVLAGVDPAGRLARLAARAPLRHVVVCIPFVSDVRPLYDLLELVLLPSHSEGLSQGLLEAMALGKPVIASGATGNLDVVTDGVDGKLVQPRNPASWARAIDALLRNRALAAQLGTAAQVTARQRFSLDLTVQRTIELYRSIVPRVG